MDLNLKNKVAIVTGGASGIGEAIVQVLSDEGAIPVILDINGERAAQLASKIQSKQKQAMAIQLDLRNEAKVIAAVGAVTDKYGHIDILINNAGKNDGVGLGRPVEDFRKSLELNLVQYYTVANACLSALTIAEGTIVNIGSKVAETGQGGTSGYAAAKGGIAALTREWAVQLLDRRIRVNAVIPAEVWTPLYESVLSHLPDPAEARRQIEKHIPLGQRMTAPEEIANMVVFLVSDCASHITGQLIHVDGGYTHLDRVVPKPARQTETSPKIKGKIKSFVRKIGGK